MSFARRFTIVAVVAALLCGLAYGVGWAAQAGSLPWQRPVDDAPAPAQPGQHVPADRVPDDRAPSGSEDEPTDEPQQSADQGGRGENEKHAEVYRLTPRSPGGRRS